MPFNVHLQDSTTLFSFNLLGVGSVCGLGSDLASIPSAWRLAIGLQLALEKVSTVHGHKCTPFCSLSHLGKRISYSLPWPWALRLHFDIDCRLDRDDTLDEISQNRRQTDQSSSCCCHPAPHEKCLACFSPWVTRWHFSHPL